MDSYHKYFSPAGPCSHISYKLLDDASRNVENANQDKVYCDSVSAGSQSPDWEGSAWYRMVEPAGTQLPEYVVDKNRCGTHASGWLNSSHPSEMGVAVDSTVCYHWGSNPCAWSSDIQIMKCDSYFLYYLPNTDVCSLRYCADSESSGKNIKTML